MADLRPDEPEYESLTSYKGDENRTTVRAGAPSRARRRMGWLPVLFLFLGFLVSVLTPTDVVGVPFLSAAPLMAASFCSLPATALTGLASMAILAGFQAYAPTGDHANDAMRALTVGIVAFFAVSFHRALRRSDDALATARVIAEAAQRAVLPLPPSRLGELEISARYQAAQTDARIGGDLYAVQETLYGTRLLVGDVRGKGLSAVEAVVIVIGAFREAAEQEATLEGVAQRLEWALSREGARRRGLDQVEGFTTAALAEVPAGEPGVLRVVNRGHPAPLLLYADGSVRYVEPTATALPLGMPELGGWPDRADVVPFPQGTHLLLYTDGLSEARDRHGVFYDPAKQLAGRGFPGPDRLLDALVADVDAHTGGGVADDMALLVARRRREAARGD